ncbi:MAG: aminodeoxychorismate synthase component I [Planctomycetota bacterium]|nr:aminodeoxychorismate synthase component I [Planctomycetota bacterium]
MDYEITELGRVSDFMTLVRGAGGHRLPAVLDTGMIVPGLGQTSFVTCEPFMVVSARGRHCTLTDGASETTVDSDPFELLREAMGRFCARPFPDESAFPCGAIGYFGYGLRHHLERLPQRAVDDMTGGGLPDMHFALYDAMLAADVATGCVRLVQYHPETDRRPPGFASAAPALQATFRRAVEAGAQDRPTCRTRKSTRRLDTGALGAPQLQANFEHIDYVRAVKRAIEYIYAGDIFQVNLSQRFSLPWKEDPIELYERLRLLSPAPFSCFLGLGQGRGVISSSPERFLKIRGMNCETRPIKGTRRRGATEAEDAELRRELWDSEKDNAELAMIVDLERNDLGKVCEFGSVRVVEARRVETYANVHHLVSTVVGTLEDDKGPIDAVKAMFPGGSITGAPKIRAMEIIDELEPSVRGVYTGAIGYLGFDGSVDLNVAIRIIQMAGDTVHYHVGGGIVADSDPESEYEETIVKGQALAQAIAAEK